MSLASTSRLMSSALSAQERFIVASNGQLFVDSDERSAPYFDDSADLTDLAERRRPKNLLRRTNQRMADSGRKQYRKNREIRDRTAR